MAELLTQRTLIAVTSNDRNSQCPACRRADMAGALPRSHIGRNIRPHNRGIVPATYRPGDRDHWGHGIDCNSPAADRKPGNSGEYSAVPGRESARWPGPYSALPYLPHSQRQESKKATQRQTKSRTKRAVASAYPRSRSPENLNLQRLRLWGFPELLLRTICMKTMLDFQPEC